MKSIEQLTDEDALEVSKLFGGAGHLCDDSRIAQTMELLTTNAFYNRQTNIAGINWYRAFKYLESKGYKIDKYEV